MGDSKASEIAPAIFESAGDLSNEFGISIWSTCAKCGSDLPWVLSRPQDLDERALQRKKAGEDKYDS